VNFWNGPRFWETYKKVENDGVTSFEYERRLFDDRNTTFPVLVLFYEDFVHNFAETSLRMFSFLKEKTLGQSMPSAEIAVACAVTNMQTEAAVKRHHSLSQSNPYLDPLGGIVKHSMVKAFCKHSKDFWYEEKWGNCLEASLQSSRDLPIFKVSKLPTEKCESRLRL